MVVLDIQEIKCDASRSATTASSPRRQVQSEAVFLVVDGGAAEEKETLLQEEKIVSKREPSGRVKLKFLNGLRGLASLLIVHHHAGYLLEVTIAPSSVDIFFVLSSFLLTMINASKIQKLVAHKASFREWIVVLLDYFVKRLLRVYPLFASNTNSLLQSRALQHSIVEPLGYFDIQEALLPLLDNAHRDCVLFHDSTFLGRALLLGQSAQGKVVGHRAVVHLGVLRRVLYTTNNTRRVPSSSADISRRISCCSCLLGSEQGDEETKFEPSKWHLVAVRAFELTMLSTMISDVCRGLLVRWFNGSLFPSQHPAVPSVSLPISTVIVIEALAPSAISRVLEWNVLCFTGKISFSMYLLHPFVNFLPWLLDLPRVDQFIVRLVLVYSLSTVSFFLIERNCQELATAIGKRLAKRAGPA
ncbi:hypothetical protein JG688_00014783 [Phytophthora aleatoria]|uniref:Acyltransferase 3 domain-containing protein n=1 Tax=Phytophthora aleatoria TaxID=2496075 RepID=A0A8J5J078_9STRA|nr:hypothetical protein JG688_00014783 [Phytophthora aleatoria]